MSQGRGKDEQGKEDDYSEADIWTVERGFKGELVVD
jgi:hypothetical protein